MNNKTISGTAVVLKASGIDTDQILPARYLNRLEKTGFDDALFSEWRQDPNFVLNRPEASNAAILFAGSDFGIGSSREHAVWALQDWGFKAVFAPSFGDIFMTNAGECGLLVGVVSQADQQRLFQAQADSSPEFEVSIHKQTIEWAGSAVSFAVDSRSRKLLLSGGDTIGRTLRHIPEIVAYEDSRSPLLPKIN